MVRPHELPPASKVGCAVTIACLRPKQARQEARTTERGEIEAMAGGFAASAAPGAGEETRMSDRELDTAQPAAPSASPPPRRVKSAEIEPKNFTLASSVTSPWLRRSSSLGINQHDGPERGFVAD